MNPGSSPYYWWDWRQVRNCGMYLMTTRTCLFSVLLQTLCNTVRFCKWQEGDHWPSTTVDWPDHNETQSILILVSWIAWRQWPFSLHLFNLQCKFPLVANSPVFTTTWPMSPCSFGGKLFLARQSFAFSWNLVSSHYLIKSVPPWLIGSLVVFCRRDLSDWRSHAQ